MSLLQASKLAKTYRRRKVVNGVGFRVDPGEIVGLLGPNGAGKTTVFKMTMGMIRPDGGTVEFDGHTVTNLPMYLRARIGMGYLAQEPSIFRQLTVEQNLLAIAETLSLSKQERLERIESLLSALEISSLRKSKAQVLSGGERRRLEIARALLTQPRLLMLDEPFAGVDPIAVGDIKSIVAHLRERHIGILITDHNVRETLDICDRAYIINDGRVIAEGTPAALLDNAEVRAVYLGEHFKL